MPSLDFSTGELIERKDVTDTLAVFRFRVAEPLSFTAGQYTTIGIRCDGEVIERPYSIVSSPYERSLEFFIELVPGGIVTPQIWNLRVGATVLIRRRVVGRFTLDSSSQRHLMLATVTGVAPFISMLRTRHFDNERGNSKHDQFLIIHGASCSADLGPYQNELEELSSEWWLKYVPTISRPWEEPNWHGEIGRVEDILRKYADQLGFNSTNSVAYACGHPQMVENVKNILTRVRYLKRQIREEQYFALHDSYLTSETTLESTDVHP
jgi:ferredoxin/flavodoxin---NADP+ reductase